MVHTYYPDDGSIGTRLDKTKSGTTTDGEGAEFDLGTTVKGKDSQVWEYVQAAGAITQNFAVGIDENGQAAHLTGAMVQAGYKIGWASAGAFSDNDFGWVCRSGCNFNGQVGSSCAADISLYATATAGVLDDAGTSINLLDGVVAVAANNTATAGPVEIMATFPHTRTP